MNLRNEKAGWFGSGQEYFFVKGSVGHLANKPASLIQNNGIYGYACNKFRMQQVIIIERIAIERTFND
jgi:hypothetical protein